MMDDKWREAQDIIQIMRLKRCECPYCEEPLEHSKGVGESPEYDFCPRCYDETYNSDGEVIGRIE